MIETQKKWLYEELECNEALIAQYKKEIKMLQTGTSIGAHVPSHERPGTISSLQESIRGLKEANEKIRKALQELETSVEKNRNLDRELLTIIGEEPGE